MLGKELPSWKQFFSMKKGIVYSEFLDDKEKWYFMAESCMSIKLVLSAVRESERKDRVTIWLPAYFCSQTYYSFKEDWVDSIFYPVNEQLEPDWNWIKEKTKEKNADCLLYVHYFGEYRDISKARQYCNNHGAILIEDCAHIAIKIDKYGKTGDFAIFSPHKSLPVPDGAILYANQGAGKRDISAIINKIDDIYKDLQKIDSDKKWYLKKFIQKVFRVHRQPTYYFGIHYGEKICSHKMLRGSKESFYVISALSREQMKKNSYIRRDNLAVMNYLIKKECQEVVCLTESAFAPYFAAYSLCNVTNKQSAIKKLTDKGYLLLYWPDLPIDIKNLEYTPDIERLSEDIFVIPIHQNLSPCGLLEIYGDKTKKLDTSIEKIVFGSVNQERWKSVLAQTDVTNIPQDWEYGIAKENVEKWKVKRGIIVDKDGKDVGVIQILIKKMLGISVAWRVNRGPVFIEEYNTTDNHINVLRMVKKMAGIRPMLAAPFVNFSPVALEKMVANGWKCKDMFGFPSATVDLTISEEELRRQLKSAWRTDLKRAEKEVCIHENNFDLEKIESDYKEFQKDKNFSGIPMNILQYLFANMPNKMKVLTAHNEGGEMVAYAIFYIHENTSTFFIAWNTQEGNVKKAPTLLLFSAMLALKKDGVIKFDLGGIEDIHTEGVARFKRGANGRDYRLIGEYWVH